MPSFQGLYTKFVSMMSPKCSIVEKDGELMLIALHTHFLPQQQYSRVAGKSAKLNNLEKVYKMPTLKEDK